MKRWALAGLTLILVGGLAFGLWWIAAPSLAEDDLLGFALEVAFFALLSGGAAFSLGIFRP